MNVDHDVLITHFGEGRLLLVKKLLGRITIPTKINKDVKCGGKDIYDSGKIYTFVSS